MSYNSQGPNIDTYGLSQNVWKNIILEKCLLGHRHYGIGFFDDFLKGGNTSLYDGYLRLQTSSATSAQVASTGNTATTGMGIWRLHAAAGDNSEGTIVWGNGLDAPFKFSGGDLAFECRIAISDLTTSCHSEFIGLAAVSAATTVQCLTAADDIYATTSVVGFQRLKDETTALDAVYQVSGQTKQDGAVQTKLDTIATLTAGTYVKLGIRYDLATNTLHWFVNGTEISAAALTSAQLAAATFPDTTFMTPIAAIMDDGTGAANLDIDWWACAQRL
jgi:hypothetical protein